MRLPGQQQLDRGLAGEQPQRVRERGGDRLAGLGDRLRAAGEVDDQGPAADHGDVAGEHPVRGVLARREPHRLGDARRLAIGDFERRFRRHVVGGEAGSAGRQHEPAALLVAEPAQAVGDQVAIVGDQIAHRDLGAERRRVGLEAVAALVLPSPALRPGGADRQDGRPRRFSRRHSTRRSCRRSCGAAGRARSRRRARSP